MNIQLPKEYSEENRISKVTLYRTEVSSRRVYIDELAALTESGAPDSNPTLTPAQVSAAVDDLDWSLVEQQKRGYDWYLRRHPQGRHAKEASQAIARRNEVRN